MSRREREESSHAKWMQAQEDKRKKIEENKLKDDAHRREVELRKKQQMNEERKKAEAKIARTEQVYEVKMRQKRSTSSDRGMKRWSWGAGADSDPLDQAKSGSMSNLVSPTTTKPRGVDDRFSKSPLLVNTTHLNFASGLRSYDSSQAAGVGRGYSPEGSPRLQRSSSVGSRPKRKDGSGFPNRTASVEHLPIKKDNGVKELVPGPAKNPPMMRGRSPAPRVSLTSTTKIRQQLAKNQKASGRPATAPLLTEPCSISPRLLAPTRSSLARSRNSINEIDDTTSQSSNASSTLNGPMRSRSKDRRAKEKKSETESAGSSPRSETAKSTPPMRRPTPDRKIKSRVGSPMLGPQRRPPSPSKTADASSGEEKKAARLSASDLSATRGPSSQTRSRRAPSPVASRQKKPISSDTSSATPPKPNSARRVASPSPAVAKTMPSSKAKGQPESTRVASTPPNIKPSLRTSVVPSKSRPQAAKVSKSKQESQKTEKSSGKTEEKAEESTKQTKSNDQGVSEVSTQNEDQNITTSVSVTSNIPKSLSDTSQAVSDIPMSSEAEDRDSEFDDSKKQIETSSSIKEESQKVEEVQDSAVKATENDDNLVPDAPIMSGLSGKLEGVENVTIVEDSTDKGKEIAESSTSCEEDSKNKQQELEEEADFKKGDNQDENQKLGVEPEEQQHQYSVQDGEDDSIKGNIQGGKILEEESSIEYFVTVNPDDHDFSPKDSLEEDVAENNLKSELEASLAEESSKSTDVAEEVDEVQQENQEAETYEPKTEEADVKVDVDEVGHQEAENFGQTDISEETQEEEALEDKNKEEVAVKADAGEVSGDQAMKEEDVKSQEKQEEVVSKEEKEDAQISDSSPPPPAEKKKEPRSNLTTDEDKEAYRRAIAEKRREAKEKKEQEERERQERIRMAKIEQAKREEEARRMFEEAAASAEEEKQREEERKQMEKEEEEKRVMMEKKLEEEANAKKQEVAERLRREREAQKQKQEDERMARKKRLEMIMRRTRQPEAEPAKQVERSSSPGEANSSGSVTPVNLSPAVGRSPHNLSPIGGQSPLLSVTPDRAVSPAIENINKSVDNYSVPALASDNNNSDVTIENAKNQLQNAEQNDQNRLNLPPTASNEVELINLGSGDISRTEDRPRSPYEAFTVKSAGITNGITIDNANNMDPFSLFSGINNGTGEMHQMEAPVNGSDNLINMNTDIISPKVTTEPLVPTGI